jgi:hypothetical protein
MGQWWLVRPLKGKIHRQEKESYRTHTSVHEWGREGKKPVTQTLLTSNNHKHKAENVEGNMADSPFRGIYTNMVCLKPSKSK